MYRVNFFFEDDLGIPRFMSGDAIRIDERHNYYLYENDILILTVHESKISFIVEMNSEKNILNMYNPNDI